MQDNMPLCKIISFSVYFHSCTTQIIAEYDFYEAMINEKYMEIPISVHNNILFRDNSDNQIIDYPNILIRLIKKFNDIQTAKLKLHRLNALLSAHTSNRSTN